MKEYMVTLAVRGFDLSMNPSAEQFMVDELKFRPYLMKPQVVLDEMNEQLVVELVAEEIDPKMCAQGLAEEFFEIASIILENPEGFYIKILSVAEMPT